MAGGLVKTAISGAKATGLSAGNLIGDGINVVMGAADYKAAREQGDSQAVSLGKAAASFAWGEFFYGGMADVTTKALLKLGMKELTAGILSTGLTIGVTALSATGQIQQVANEHTTKTMTSGYGHRGKLGSGYFNMSEAGYTMRQRSLNAIRSNGLNTQSVLGNEARTYFRGSL